MKQGLKDIIYNTVIEANEKMTPGEVEKAAALATGADREDIKLAIRDLVSQGELNYTYLYGTSYLERSFDRPIRVSTRIVIKPPDKEYRSQADEVVVNIAAGVAFGSGAHPSTVLALRALDAALAEPHRVPQGTPFKGLDVGTGSGILAIAMAKLGVQEVVAVDIDPSAIFEATHNVRLNDLAERITVSDTPIEEFRSRFHTIVANLAHPTLKRTGPLFLDIMEKDGLLVLSGFKELAFESVCTVYVEQGLTLIREEKEREWMTATFCKAV
jgi:ribosomal protein L11 methyltransferase